LTDVLGTAVTALPADDRPALLVSDLHVPADGGEVVEHLCGVFAAAQRLMARVFVLGDLFDSYVTRAQIRTGVWRDVAAHFAAAARAGVEIRALHGNRDFLLGPEFEAASGASLCAGGLRVRLAGADTLLLHGDELCQNDLPYQRAKRWLRHPVTRWVARHLPLSLALAAAGRARAKSAMVVAGGDQQRFLPTRRALDAAFATGVLRLVFGHIHRHATGPFGGGRYWVLPAFDATATGLLAADGAFTAVRFAGASGEFVRVAEPPECPFPA
jgi:UDP-2,3-diacylglucosamine hydrolase